MYGKEEFEEHDWTIKVLCISLLIFLIHFLIGAMDLFWCPGVPDRRLMSERATDDTEGHESEPVIVAQMKRRRWGILRNDSGPKLLERDPPISPARWPVLAMAAERLVPT